jgi:hypothetical protein
MPHHCVSRAKYVTKLQLLNKRIGHPNQSIHKLRSDKVGDQQLFNTL